MTTEEIQAMSETSKVDLPKVRSGKRGRPKGSKASNSAGQQTREQLLKASRKLFSKRGFAGVSTAYIAAEAGVSKAVITHHFTNKRKLYAAVLEEVSAGLKHTLEAAFDPKLSPQESISLLVDGVLAWGQDYPEQARILAYDLLELPERDKDKTVTQWKLGAVMQQVMNLVDTAKREGALPRELDTMAVIELIFGLVTYHVMVEPYDFHILALDPDADKMSRFPERAKALLTRALRE
jgi:AcrR family transcriptional regulator